MLGLEESELFEQLFSDAAQGICDELAADCARSESGTCGPESGDGSIDSSSESPSQHRKTTCWWAPILKKHVEEHAWDPLHMRPVSLVSACAGSCAEAEVLRVTWLVRLVWGMGLVSDLAEAICYLPGMGCCGM